MFFLGVSQCRITAPSLPLLEGRSSACPSSCPALCPGVTQLAQMDSSVSSSAVVTLISKQYLERGPVTSVSPLETPHMNIKEEVRQTAK